MKILHVSKYDLKGGAAIAAYNSMHAQRDLGLDARMAVGRKLGDDPLVSGPSYWGDKISLLRFAGEQFPGRLMGADRYDSRSMGLFGRGRRALFDGFEPDVVVLHNIDGVLSLRQLRDIRQPVIWRMHDLWAVSGHRHYEGGYHPRPARFGALATLIDKHLRNTKLELPARRKLLYCPPSQWLAASARKALGPAPQVVVVPNGVDVGVFRPTDRDEARAKIGIDHRGPLLLFGAASGPADLRKGGDLLLQALVSQRDELLARNVKLAVFGGDWPPDWSGAFEAISLGKIRERDRLALAYSAADLTIVPSREENLSLTVLESLACGTPVVAFDIGGMPDMIDDGRNGWLIPPFDLGALGQRLLATDRWSSLRVAARESILGRFDRASEAKGMLSLYRQLAPGAGRAC